MKKAYEVLRIVLPILGLILGGIKVLGVPIETDTFRQIGAPHWAMPVAGLFQAFFGAAIYFRKLESFGLWASTAFLALAVVLMAAHGMPRALVPATGAATLLFFAYARGVALRGKE